MERPWGRAQALQGPLQLGAGHPPAALKPHQLLFQPLSAKLPEKLLCCYSAVGFCLSPV